MNQKTSEQENSNFRIHYNEKQAIERVSEKVISWFPRLPREYIVVCIGTDRSTGDALGPLTGTLLTAKKPRHLNIYGTLHQPVHATNLTEYISDIKHKHRHPFIIAVDACLGRHASIGHLITGLGPLKPGAALKKALPEIGDIHLTGVVNSGGFMDHAVLQSTRLSMVMDMAETFAELLDRIDQQLSPSFIRPAVLRHYPERNEMI